MYSAEHQQFLKKIKTRKFLILFAQILIFVLFIAIWQFLANHNYINTFIFSSPQKILDCLIHLHQKGGLYNHIGITVWETFISFVIGSFIGLIIATIMWWNKFLSKVIDPYLTILNSLPKVALGPIIIIWAGAGIKSIILMALLISVVVTVLSIYQGFMDTDSIKIKLLQSLQATKRQIYFKLILPSSLPSIISALKINISMCLIGL